tara:strand:+ start:574 stop:1326 length:753 start_codon:yes stop_codon:yes gene_type:complete
MAYTKPSWMTWADEGGSLFGQKDVTKALQENISYDKILKAVQESDAIAKARDPNNPNIESGGGRFSTAANLTSAYEAAQSGKLDSSQGVTGYTGGADINLYAQGRGGMTTKVAQEIRDQANYNPNLKIGGAMHTNMMNIGSWAASQDAADSAKTDAEAAADWRESEATKRANEATKRYNAMIAAQEAAAEAAKTEALKVKSSSPSAVQGGSPLSIRSARSPAYRSGAASRGTSQFARTGKGSNVKGINIA